MVQKYPVGFISVTPKYYYLVYLNTSSTTEPWLETVYITILSIESCLLNTWKVFSKSNKINHLELVLDGLIKRKLHFSLTFICFRSIYYSLFWAINFRALKIRKSINCNLTPKIFVFNRLMK